MSNQSKLPPVKFTVGNRVFHLTYGWGVISGSHLDYTYAHLDDGSNPVVQSSGHRYVLTAAEASLLGLVDPKAEVKQLHSAEFKHDPLGRLHYVKGSAVYKSGPGTNALTPVASEVKIGTEFESNGTDWIVINLDPMTRGAKVQHKHSNFDCVVEISHVEDCLESMRHNAQLKQAIPEQDLDDSWNPFEKGRVNLDLLSPNSTKPSQAEACSHKPMTYTGLLKTETICRTCGVSL